MNVGNEYKRKIIFTILSIFGAAIIGFAVLCFVYLIPTSPIREEVKRSVPVFEKETEIFNWAPNYSFAYADNFTDSIILNTASFASDESVFSNALMNYRYQSNEPYASQILSLSESMTSSDSESHKLQYARYWHGYLVFIKPLLTILDYSAIRLLNFFIQFILAFAVIRATEIKLGKRVAFAFMGVLFIISPITTGLCLQLSPVYYITLLSSLAILLKGKDSKIKDWQVLLWTGIAVSYFDLLTYPIVSLGIPLLFSIAKGVCHNFTDQIKQLMECSFFWGIGYGGMWFSKWLLATLVTGKNVIADAISNIFIRTNNQVTEAGLGNMSITKSEAIAKNFDQLANRPFMIVAILLLTIIALLTVVQMLRKSDFFHFSPRIVMIDIILFYPLCWYIVLSNHSYIHYWMTYRGLCISYFSLMLTIIYLFKNSKKRSKV